MKNQFNYLRGFNMNMRLIVPVLCINLIATFAMPVTPNAQQPAPQAWTPRSPEQIEYEFLMRQCNAISERHSNSAATSPSLQSALFNYLKNVGTPVSLQVLKDLVAQGRVNAAYLKQV
jgi:hypothetical protein